MDTVMIMALLKGAGMGAIAVVLGYLKSVGAAGQLTPFQLKSLGWKALLGAIIGAVAVKMGTTFGSAYEWAVGVGLISVADQLIKVLIRRGTQAAKAINNKMMASGLLILFVLMLAGCTPNAQFVRAVDQHTAIINR